MLKVGEVVNVKDIKLYDIVEINNYLCIVSGFTKFAIAVEVIYYKDIEFNNHAGIFETNFTNSIYKPFSKGSYYWGYTSMQYSCKFVKSNNGRKPRKDTNWANMYKQYKKEINGEI